MFMIDENLDFAKPILQPCLLNSSISQVVSPEVFEGLLSVETVRSCASQVE